jgi:uncharacterized membrane protein
MFWGMLFGLLFFIPVFEMAIGAGLGALMGKMAKTGIDRQFQDQVRGMDGTVLKTSLSKDDEQELQEALHGGQATAQ